MLQQSKQKWRFGLANGDRYLPDDPNLNELVIKAVVLKAFRHVSLKSCSYWRKVYLTRRLPIY